MEHARDSSVGRKLAQYESDELVDHRTWLESHRAGLGARFERRWSTDPESCIVEARVRALLQAQTEIQPFEKAKEGGPDFLCRTPSAQHSFFVECTAIQVLTATKRTGLEDPLRPGPRGFGPLTPVIKEKLSSKSAQLAFLNAPVVLVCGTLHFDAGVAPIDPIFLEWLLHGPDHLRVLLGREAPSDLWEPLYTSPSAVVMIGLGGLPARTWGVINPGAKLRLEPSWLPDWPFCRVTEWPSSREEIPLEWVKGQPSRVVNRDEAHRH